MPAARLTSLPRDPHTLLMTRRRARYTVEFKDGSKKVCLAYDSAGAATLYERRGLKVASVTKGDYRQQESIPAFPSGAKPDLTAVREAAEFLGIKQPTKIVTNSRVSTHCGHHQLLPTGGNTVKRGNRVLNADTATGWVHRIMVKDWLSADQMGKTLWHELTHAMQVERDCLLPGLTPSQVLSAWKTAYRDGTSYNRKPWEIEARSYEQHNDEMPLAR